MFKFFLHLFMTMLVTEENHWDLIWNKSKSLLAAEVYILKFTCEVMRCLLGRPLTVISLLTQQQMLRMTKVRGHWENLTEAIDQSDRAVLYMCVHVEAFM